MAGAVLRGIPALVILLIALRMARDDERARFEHAAVDDIDRSLLGEDERETLLRKSRCRPAVQEMRPSSGPAAAIALKELQQAQVELVEIAINEGLATEDYEDAAHRVRTAKESLADLL